MGGSCIRRLGRGGPEGDGRQRAATETRPITLSGMVEDLYFKAKHYNLKFKTGAVLNRITAHDVCGMLASNISASMTAVYRRLPSCSRTRKSHRRLPRKSPVTSLRQCRIGTPAAASIRSEQTHDRQRNQGAMERGPAGVGTPLVSPIRHAPHGDNAVRGEWNANFSGLESTPSIQKRNC